MSATSDQSPPPRSARQLGPQDLVWDHFSRPRHDDVVARIHAAADAGFAGIGLYLGAWKSLREDSPERERVDAALAETSMVVANIEVVRGWASPDVADQQCLINEALAFEMADHFGCRYLQAIGDYTGTIAEAATGFGALCDRAAEHGLLVGLEWVPEMTNIETAATATAIVEAADRDNGGFCVDAWHITRSTNDIADITNLPGDRVFATQWSDGPVVRTDPGQSYYEDCLANRVVPGTGEFSLVAMVQALDSIGSTAPIGLEVCSADLWEGPVEHAAVAAADGMRKVLRQARTDSTRS